VKPHDLIDAMNGLLNGLSSEKCVANWLHRAVRGDVAAAQIQCSEVFYGDDGKRLERLIEVVLDMTDPRGRLPRAKGPDPAEQAAARALLAPTIELLKRRIRIAEEEANDDACDA